MKFDGIGRDPFLTFKVIKKADAGNLYGHAGILESRRRRKHRVELRARMRDAGGKGTAWAETTWIRDLGNHCAASAVFEDHVIVGIKRACVFHQRGAHNPSGGFGGLDSGVVGKRGRRCDTGQSSNRGRSCRTEVYQTCVRIDTGLNGPALA